MKNRTLPTGRDADRATGPVCGMRASLDVIVLRTPSQICCGIFPRISALEAESAEDADRPLYAGGMRLPPGEIVMSQGHWFVRFR
jgi:hypothetical protein